MLCLVVVGTAKCHAQQKNAVKVTFLSWITGSTKLSYERAFPALKQSGEFCTSLISAGYDKFKNDPMGFTLRYSHKFFVAGYDESKPLMGFYLRPRGNLLALQLYALQDRATNARAHGCSARHIWLSVLL